MNYWRIFAILLAVFTIGMFSETARNFSSQDADIADNRASLIPMALSMTALFLFGTFYCWRKENFITKLSGLVYERTAGELNIDVQKNGMSVKPIIETTVPNSQGQQ